MLSPHTVNDRATFGRVVSIKRALVPGVSDETCVEREKYKKLIETHLLQILFCFCHNQEASWNCHFK